MRTTHVAVIAALLSASTAAMGQNLLVNPSFDLPETPNDCEASKGAPSDWIADQGALTRNGVIHHPRAEYCPRDGDGIHASWEHCCSPASRRAYQTVTLDPPADGVQAYKFSGYYYLGSSDSVTGIQARFAIIVGSNPNNPPLAQATATQTNGESDGWVPFAVTAVPPSGTTTVTVLFGFTAENNSFNGMHVDGCEFGIEVACPVQPTLTGVTPSLAVRGSTLNVTLSGTNFDDSGSTPIVRLTGPQTIVASNVTVDSPTQVTATFTIPPDAPHAQYSLEYDQNGCTLVTLPGTFLVYLPQFTNGSFELPAVTSCDTPSNTFPSEWRAGESSEWGFEGRLKLNGFLPGGLLPIKPSCPPPDGSQYGTMASDSSTGGANAVSFQTVAVSPGTHYTFSGFFAGSGDNTVLLRLKDGGPGGTVLASKAIHQGAGSYDWSFAYVEAQAASDAMTIEWAVQRTGGSLNAAHADALAFEQCVGTTPSLISVTPSFAVNNGPLQITNLAGTNFSGTPTVILNKPGTTLTATNVQVVSPTQITATVDLTGVSSGRYDVIVKQGGCVVTQPGVSILVAAQEFVNGSFEEPEAPLDCGPPPVEIAGIPTGWNSDTGLRRDGNAPVPPDCPSPDGGHYGFMSEGAGGTLRAWQTIAVLPGGNYTFSGFFGGLGNCVISLLDGDENGPPLASTIVFTGEDGKVWVPGTVSANAVSNVMTVMWEIQNAAPGGMADGLTFSSNCNPAWADADGDTDVDMDDFGIFQRCYTGPLGPVPTEPEYCPCFDRNGDGAIAESDFVQFMLCARGSGVPVSSCQ